MGGARKTGRRAAVVLAAAAALATPVALAGEGTVPNPPWPQALPPGSALTSVQPHPVRNCRHADIGCVDLLASRLRGQWQRFDRTCDHRAVISYSYLQITRGLRADLALPHPGLVKYRRWMTYLITAFSNRYWAAFRAWREHRPLPEGWRIAFQTAAHGDANAGQDVLLFSNVHVQHDLPLAYERMGLRAPNGASHKPDHDAVNEVNARVFNPIEDYIAAHYDPMFEQIDAKPSPLDEIGTLELVKSWREQAWRSAERLLAAKTPEEHAQVMAQINETTNAWAHLIAGGGTPGHRAERDAWCQEHHASNG